MADNKDLMTVMHQRIRDRDYHNIKHSLKSGGLTTKQKSDLLLQACVVVNIDKDIIKLFIDHGADTNYSIDDIKKSILHAVIMNQHGEFIDIVKMLVENGASPLHMIDISYPSSQKRHYGFRNGYDDNRIRTPYELAKDHGKYETAKYLAGVEHKQLSMQYDKIFNADIATLIDKINILDEQIVSNNSLLKDKIKKQQTTRNILSNNVDSLNTDIKGLKESINIVQKENAEIVQSNNNVVNEVDAMSIDNNKLQAVVDALKQDIDVANTNIDTNAYNNKILKANISTLMKTTKSLTNDYIVLKNKSALLSGAVENANSVIERLSQSVMTLEDIPDIDEQEIIDKMEAKMHEFICIIIAVILIAIVTITYFY